MPITFAKNVSVYKTDNVIIIYVDNQKMTLEQFNEWVKSL